MDHVHSQQYIDRQKRDKKERFIRCKICGKEFKKRQSFSRHLGHAHSQIPEVKRERMVIDAFFGVDRVNSVIKDFIAGKFDVSNLPINIAKYLNLKGIKPEKEKVKHADKKEKAKEEENPTSYCIVEIETKIEKDEDDDGEETEKEIFYVRDAHVDEEEKLVTLYLTEDIQESITLEEIRSKIIDYKDFKVNIKYYEETMEIDSIEFDKEDKIGTIVCKQ